MSGFHSEYKQQLLIAAGALFGSGQASGTSHRHARTRVRRRGSLLGAIAIGMLVLAAAAFAAERIVGVGARVRSPHRSEGSPRRGVGVPVRGSGAKHRTASLLGVSVADPGGGLPWGMRIVTTTRGLVCLQVGRLMDGRLGILGQDGLFKDDGRFHEIPPGAIDQSTCSQPDVRALYKASSLSLANVLAGESLPCGFEYAGLRPCPLQDEQTVAFGVLGAHGVSVAYNTPAGRHEVATSSKHGAYLIVLPSTQASPPASGFMAVDFAPTEQLSVQVIKAYLLSTIVFGDGGRLCQVGPVYEPDGPRGCSPAETAASGRNLPTVIEPGSPVKLAAQRRPGGYALHLSFLAPTAVRNSATAYAAEYTVRGNRSCESGGAGEPIERDIRRGQRVEVTLLVNQKPGCRGVVDGQIILGRQASALTGPTYDKKVIGNFSFALPKSG